MEKGRTFAFDESQFNRIYPFHFLLDRNMMLVGSGPALNKLLPKINQEVFRDIFQLKRPGLVGIGFDHLSKNPELIILESVLIPGLLLRGQFEYLEAEDLLIFLGSPWFQSIEELTSHHLTFHDFATHDPLIDLLHVIKSKEIATNETMHLLHQMQLQKNEYSVSAQRLGQLISNLQTGILLEDENRKIVLTNKTFCKIFGLDFVPESMIGWDCSNTAEQSKHMFTDPEKFVERITALLQNRELVLEEKLYLVDGRVLERDYIPIFINQVYRGHLWKYTDVTEKEVQQDLLRKSEEKYRGIITNINLGLIEVDLDENILYANQSFLFISGYKEHELIGKNAVSLFIKDPFNREQMRNRLKRRKNKLSDLYETEVVTKSGEKKWWLVSGAPLLSDLGEVIGSIGIHLDITLQKNLEQELREAKLKAEKSAQARELFLANMSHEIRTPLSGIYGMMQLLQTTEMDQEQQSYIDAIEKAIENLQNIINDILDFSKINSGMIELAHLPFSLKEEIDAVCKLAWPKAKAKGLELSMNYSADLADFYKGDALRLGQIFSNLINNAIKFTEKGFVEIRCCKSFDHHGNKQVNITISDSGIGIDPQFLPFIFDKFTQEENGKSRQYGGTGLGMSICKQLVELMHGEISVQSEKNKGTQVSIFLPLEESNAGQEKSTIGEPRLSLNGRNILVAEDNEINATVLRSLLTKEGAQVKLVDNGKKLIEAASNEYFDLIISDVQMPVMNGIEAVMWIRKNLSKEIKIIGLTANAFRQEKERCIKAGFDRVLYKPFKKNDLLKECSEQLLFNEKTTPAPANFKSELYDLTELMEMMDHSTSQMKMLLTQFVQETPKKIKNIRKAVRENDLSGLRANVHYMASSIQHLHIASLYKPLKRLDNSKLSLIGSEEVEYAEEICRTLEKVIKQIKENYGC